MSTAVAPQIITPEDLLAMPDGKSYELVNGQLVERHMGARSGWIGGRLFSRMDRYVEEAILGFVWHADTGFQCFPHDPTQVRKPDIAFVKTGRLTGGQIPEGWIKIPPDLVVEVVSPNDLASELDEKIHDYQLAGIPLIWVIYPNTRSAQIYRPDGSPTQLHESDELSGEQIIPGFRCPLSEIFPPAAQSTTMTRSPA